MSLYSSLSRHSTKRRTNVLGEEPTGCILNITTEERKFMSITNVLRERNQ